MIPVIPLSFIVGLLPIFLYVLQSVALWQRKEYRLDRVWSYINSQEYPVFRKNIMILWGLSMALAWVLYIGAFSYTYQVQWITFIIGLGFIASDIFTKGVNRPVWTVKSIIVVGASLCAVVSLIYSFFIVSQMTDVVLLQWTTGVFFIPCISGIIAMSVNVLSYGPKYYTIRNATALRQKLSSIPVVGITGSVGKTSTKYFIEQLYKKATVSKQHRNSAYMIAIDVLEQFNQNIELYVAEMGAYTKGEIAQLVSIARPTIGVLTSIRNQHVALFGSVENLAKAKWELIEGLPKNGIAILNADDAMIKKMAKLHKATLPEHVIWYSTKKKADIYATNIEVLPKSIKATLYIENFARNIEIPLLGGAMLSNILAAVAVLHAHKMPKTEIIENLSKLQPFPQTMELRKGIKNSIIIDDSYSASEDSVIEAINHVSRFENKDTRIVLVPIIELGQAGNDVHIRINKVLNKTSAKVYLYGQSYRSVLQPDNGQWYNDPQGLISAVTKDVTRNTVILLEGRIPEIVRKSIIK